MWFILALFAGFLFAANRLIVRSSLTKNINPLAFGAIHELIAGVLLIPIAIFHLSFPHNLSTLIALILGVFFIFLTDIFAFFALKYTEASIYQIIGQLRHIIVLFGAFLLFSEAITFNKIVSIILIMIGVGIVLLDKLKITITKGVIYAFLSTIFIALAFLFIKKASIDVAPTFSASLSLLVSGILTLIILLKNKRNNPIKIIHKESLEQLVTAAITFAIFEITLFTALAIGEASRVTPVTQSSMIFTILGGYLFLNEKTQLKKKIVGSIIIALGIILLYFI